MANVQNQNQAECVVTSFGQKYKEIAAPARNTTTIIISHRILSGGSGNDTFSGILCNSTGMV
jgi:hypothetical protein